MAVSEGSDAERGAQTAGSVCGAGLLRADEVHRRDTPHVCADARALPRGARRWLASELKSEVELTIADGAQHTWAAARARLPADSVAVAVEEPSGRQLLLSLELPLLLQSVECLLGGQARAGACPARLTDIDWALARGLLDGVVRELSHAWVELGGQELMCGEIDIEGDAGVAPAGGRADPHVALQSTIGGAASAMALLIPWTAFEPAAESAHEEAHPRAGSTSTAVRGAAPRPRQRTSCSSARRSGPPRCRSSGCSRSFPASWSRSRSRAEDGVRLFAEEVAIGHGTPGRSGTRRAIKVRPPPSSPPAPRPMPRSAAPS